MPEGSLRLPDGGGGGGAELVVVAETIFERLPNTASRFSVPRNAISWKL
jgi:hypothetical protein